MKDSDDQKVQEDRLIGAHQPDVLSYGRTSSSRSPYLALGLTAPGAMCWFVVIWNHLLRLDPLPFIDSFGLLCLVWFVAVLCAITSVALFCRKPSAPLPWYVLINLALNIPGLFFTVVFLCGLML